MTEITGNTRRLRLEALLACPPTTRCRQLLERLQALAADWPDQVRLDVYYAGEPPHTTPTEGYQALDKRKSVPSGYLNGSMIDDELWEDPAALRRELVAELNRGPDTWE